MKLTSPTKMIATALTIAVVAAPVGAAADIPAGQPAPGGDGRIASTNTSQQATPQGFDFRVPAEQLVSNWPEGQPAPGGNGRTVDLVSYWPEGQPAPGGNGRVSTPEVAPVPVPVGFNFKTPAEWVTAIDGAPAPISIPTPGGFDLTDAVLGASVALGAALMALLTAFALRRRGGLAHS
jgi:hypothetical protein